MRYGSTYKNYVLISIVIKIKARNALWNKLPVDWITTKILDNYIR